MPKFHTYLFLSLTAISFAEAKSYAACSWSNPGNCLSDPIGTGAVFLGEYRFTVKNKCSVPIRIAVSYVPIYASQPSYIGGSPGSGTSWKADGWWELSPGESNYVADTENKYIYLYAESLDGALTWGEDKFGFRYNGDFYPALEVNMGGSFTEFEQSLTCN